MALDDICKQWKHVHYNGDEYAKEFSDLQVSSPFIYEFLHKYIHNIENDVDCYNSKVKFNLILNVSKNEIGERAYNMFKNIYKSVTP